jgi:signal transduction histidine kinase
VQLPIVFSVIVLSFLAATTFADWRLNALDRASLDIAENAAPSIERLTSARGEMRHLQVLLREYLDRRAIGAPADEQPIQLSRISMDRFVDEYLALPVFPGERDLWGDILRSKDELNEAVTTCVTEAHRGDLQAAEARSRHDVAIEADDLNMAITKDIEFNAGHSRDLAVQMRQLHGRSRYIAFGLDAACAGLTLAGALTLRRALREHGTLEARHRRLVEERASELEQFAGTVAHDILSPLGVVSLSLQLAGGPGEEEVRARYVTRGVNALERVKRLVQGLLEFARAGAKPDRSARTDVAGTISDLVEHIGADATRAGVELTAEVGITSYVACNAGVLMSLVGNLTRNAIKYAGDGPLRRVEIRALDRGEVVRVEVEDNGPGLSPGLDESVFDPYVRGSHATQPGIGLGLATVKRLAKAHGGECGVHSVPGEGCTFWFELPKAPGIAQEDRELTTATIGQ